MGSRGAYLDLEELLDRYLTKDDLKQIAEEYDLPKGGSKRELVARIASEVPHEDLLHCFHVEDLKEILREHGLPRSGTKAELVERVLSLIETLGDKYAEEKRKLKRRIGALADEIVNYLENFTIGPIRLRDETELEYYMFGRLEEFFRGRGVRVSHQAIGIRDRSKPDIIVQRGKETVIVELKYIRKQRDYDDGITQAMKYSSGFERAKVILFCYDPEKRIKQLIRNIPKEVTPLIKN